MADIIVPPLSSEARHIVNGDRKCGCGEWFTNFEDLRNHLVNTKNFYCENSTTVFRPRERGSK